MTALAGSAGAARSAEAAGSAGAVRSAGTADGSRTIPAMNARDLDTRELLLTTALLVGASRLAEPPLLWPLAVLVLIATGIVTLQVLAPVDPAAETAGVPVESLILPATVAVAAVGAVRLVPVGLLLLPALGAMAWLLDRTLRTEAAILASPRLEEATVSRSVMGWLLVVAFLGFLGAAATVPGGLPDPTGALFAPTGIRLRNLAVLAGADALVAALLGYRAAALRGTRLREVAWSAVTCGLAVAIAAAALRAMALPRFLGPALLVIVFYLWDAIHAAVRTDRRDVRRTWEAILLAITAVVVIVWSFNVQG